MGSESFKALEVALWQNKPLEEILARFEEIALPDSWLAAGCIAHTIWNISFGQPPEFGFKDVDLIYFFEDLPFEARSVTRDASVIYFEAFR